MRRVWKISLWVLVLLTLAAMPAIERDAKQTVQVAIAQTHDSDHGQATGHDHGTATDDHGDSHADEHDAAHGDDHGEAAHGDTHGDAHGGDHGDAHGGAHHDGGNLTFSNTTRVLEGTTWMELHPAARPSARCAFGMVYDSERDRLVIFGGNVIGVAYDETWELY